MMKNSFEEKLRGLPWRAPQASLRERIFDSPPKNRDPFVRVFFDGRIPLGWAAALMLAVGAIGYGVGRSGDSLNPSPARLGRTDLCIIETGVAANFFDMTLETEDPWPGPLDLSVQETSEKSG